MMPEFEPNAKLLRAAKAGTLQLRVPWGVPLKTMIFGIVTRVSEAILPVTAVPITFAVVEGTHQVPWRLKARDRVSTSSINYHDVIFHLLELYPDFDVRSVRRILEEARDELGNPSMLELSRRCEEYKRRVDAMNAEVSAILEAEQSSATFL